MPEKTNKSEKRSIRKEDAAHTGPPAGAAKSPADQLRHFMQYLADNGLKLTDQRRLILDTVLKSEEHLSAEELFHRLRALDPSIGQATVYRTLRLLRDCSLVRELRFAGDVVRFEARRDAEHHDHLVCESCGKTIEFMDESIEKLQAQLAEKMGFILTSHRMYLYGLCGDCRTSGRAPNGRYKD